MNQDSTWKEDRLGTPCAADMTLDAEAANRRVDSSGTSVWCPSQVECLRRGQIKECSVG